MTIFDEIAEVRKKAKRVEDKVKLLEIETKTPRASTISDMPKGGGNAVNPIEWYVIKKEELNNKLKAINTRVEMLWQKAICQMNDAGIDKQVQKMMYFRFVRGMKWEKCANLLNVRYPNNKWNVNKCFREYRGVLCKIPKK